MQQLADKIHNLINETSVNLSKVELIELKVPQREVFQSAVGERKSRDVLIVKMYDDEGNYGFGECSCRPDPFYSCEFLDAAWMVVENFIVPLLPQQLSYSNLLSITKKMRGWHFTGAAVEMAFNDLIQRRNGQDLLTQMSQPKIQKIPVGISLGLFPSKEKLMDKVQRSVQEGYHRIKFKIKPGIDFQMFSELRSQFPNLYFGYDANGSFSDKTFKQLIELVSTTKPHMLEQPFAPDRLDLCVRFRKESSTPICLDESIRSLGTLITAHQMEALDELNIKPGRVGGVASTAIIIEYCQMHNIPMWVGGMFETGVGRMFNLRVASLLTNAKAHDLSPASRYFEKDIITQPIDMTTDGYIHLENHLPPELQQETIEEFLVRKKTLVKTPTNG